MNTQEQNREALIRHIADLDAVIRRRNEQIENQAHNARETQRALEEIARERDEARANAYNWKATAEEWEKSAARVEPRPLTPDAITDDMVRRALDATGRRQTVVNSLNGSIMRQALVAALTEPPARPEGAEEWEDWLIEALPHESMPDEDIARLADQIAARATRRDEEKR